MLQALGKQNLNLRRKILVFLLFPTQFCKLGFADPVTTLLNTAATKLNLNVERKMLVFLLFPTHVSKLGSRTRCLEVQMTTAKSCCFIQDKTTKRKAT